MERRLAEGRYDCVVSGAGVRLPPSRLVLFEALVNAIRRAAPNVCTSTSPDSGLSSLRPELHGVDLGHDLLLQPLEVVEGLRNRHVLERRPEERHR